MRFTVIADTDIGNTKSTNQDSVLVKHAESENGEVILAVICDGMGGLSKGEVASATVIKAFSKWFDDELAAVLKNLDVEAIGEKWSLMLKELNEKISDYSYKHGLDGVGTTFSGILIAENQFVIAHVGDSRIYHIGSTLNQLTNDQTFVAREVSRGNLTPEQAKTDKRRNLLLQCVGASKIVEPEMLVGKAEKGIYLLCSDGFRHEISEEEICDSFSPIDTISKKTMQSNARYLINLVKLRKERDNISVIAIKAQ